ncbi:ankyrin repeat-containing domain protein [Pelagophyceae sp. CCMP2097]|nr:ankyrin repeat-containing domain protein [Pelagophyceae sp. CCMP2097]
MAQSVAPLAAWAELVPELVRSVAVLAVQRPRDVADFGTVCKRWRSELRLARLDLTLDGRRADWALYLSAALRSAPSLERLRLHRTNATEADVAQLETLAPKLVALVVSKSFRLGACLEPGLLNLAELRLRVAHFGDAAPKLSAPTLRNLCILGLTNSTIQEALVHGVLRLPNLQKLFLGGCDLAPAEAPPPAGMPAAALGAGPPADVDAPAAPLALRPLVLETTAMAAACRACVFDHVAGVAHLRRVRFYDFNETPVEALAGAFAGGDVAAALEAADARKQTALHVAATLDDAERVDFLLRRGGDVEARDGSGATPLVRACEAGSARCVELLLLNCGAATLALANHRHESALNAAAVHGHAPCVERVARYERALAPGEPFSTILAKRADKEGFSALHAAIVGRRPHVLEALLRHLSEDTYPRTPIRGHLSEDPRRRCAGIDAANRYGQTALHLAARAGDAALAEMLLRAGCALDARDERGHTPLDVCLVHTPTDACAGRDLREACAQSLRDAGATAGARAAPRKKPGARARGGRATQARAAPQGPR